MSGHFDFRNWDGSTQAILNHYEADEKIIGDLRDEAVHHAEWAAIQLMQMVDSPIERRLLLALVSPHDIRDEHQVLLPGRVRVVAPRSGHGTELTESAVRCASEARRLLCARFGEAMERSFALATAEASKR